MVRVRCKKYPSAQAHIVPQDPHPRTGIPRRWAISSVPYGEVIELRLPVIQGDTPAERKANPGLYLKGKVIGYELNPDEATMASLADVWEPVGDDADPELVYRNSQAKLAEAMAEHDAAKAAVEQQVMLRSQQASEAATLAAAKAREDDADAETLQAAERAKDAAEAAAKAEREKREALEAELADLRARLTPTTDPAESKTPAPVEAKPTGGKPDTKPATAGDSKKGTKGTGDSLGS